MRDYVIGVPLASVSVHVFLRVPIRAMDVQVSHDNVAMILKTLRKFFESFRSLNSIWNYSLTNAKR